MHLASTRMLKDAGRGGATCGAIQRNNSSTDESLRTLLTILNTYTLILFQDTNIT